MLSHVFLPSSYHSCFRKPIWYFVSPYEMFSDIMQGSLGPWIFWSWVLFFTLSYLDLAFIRQRFCRSSAPIQGQSTFFDDRTLTIGFNKEREDECHRCEACVPYLSTGIDIREGLQIECINCAECIDACAGQMSMQGKDPLIEYSQGVFERQRSERAGAPSDRAFTRLRADRNDACVSDL